MNSDFYIANLDFFLNYDDGTSNDEIESEIYKVCFQIKNTVHYDRSIGGGFQEIEQEPIMIPQLLVLKFGSNIVESVYYVNEEKGFNPYIVVGFSDITAQSVGTTLNVLIKYRLLKDLTTTGQISIEL